MLSNRQNEIINAALDIIAKNGIQNFTTKNLAKTIGISEAALYRHFASKTEILLTMLEQIRIFKLEIFNEIAETNQNIFDKINHVFFKLLSKFEETPSIVSVIFSDEIFKNDEILSNKINEIMDNYQNLFIKILVVAQQNREIRNDVDAKYLIMFLLGGLRLLVRKWEKSNYKFDLISEGKRLTKVFESLLI